MEESKIKMVKFFYRTGIDDEIIVNIRVHARSLFYIKLECRCYMCRHFVRHFVRSIKRWNLCSQFGKLISVESLNLQNFACKKIHLKLGHVRADIHWGSEYEVLISTGIQVYGSSPPRLKTVMFRREFHSNDWSTIKASDLLCEFKFLTAIFTNLLPYKLLSLTTLVVNYFYIYYFYSIAYSASRFFQIFLSTRLMHISIKNPEMLDLIEHIC